MLELGRVCSRSINHIYAATDTELLPAICEVPTNLTKGAALDLTNLVGSGVRVNLNLITEFLKTPEHDGAVRRPAGGAHRSELEVGGVPEVGVGVQRSLEQSPPGA